jgi:hypothetical protein
MFKAPDLTRRHAQVFDLPEFIGSAIAMLMIVCGGALATGYAAAFGSWLIGVGP